MLAWKLVAMSCWGILGRSLHNYFLMEDDNVNQPANFTANKVTGIVSTAVTIPCLNGLDTNIPNQLFENKVDHTTYFGANLEFVQGYVHHPSAVSL